MAVRPKGFLRDRYPYQPCSTWPPFRAVSRTAPAPRSEMMLCWQDGRRMLKHPDEVARLMKKERPRREEAPSLDARVKPAHEARGGKTCDLAPPPVHARRRSLAQNEVWQMLAKRMVRVAGHPPRCHKRRCRRMKECQGGANACYLREFETVDVIMQRHVLPAIAKKAREVLSES